MLTDLNISMLEVFESFWGIDFFLFPFNLLNTLDKLCGPKIFSVLLYFWLDLCLVPSVQKNEATAKSRFVNIWWIHNVGVKWNFLMKLSISYVVKVIAFHSYVHRCLFLQWIFELSWMTTTYIIGGHIYETLSLRSILYDYKTF